MAGLTVASAGFAAAVAGALLVERGRSPWWGLIVLLVGFESVVELTPELLAFALVGFGVMRWLRGGRVDAVVLFSAAALCRESMLLAVAALGAWQFLRLTGGTTARLRRLWPLAIPFATYGGWVIVVRARVGSWPVAHSRDRLGWPVVGLARAFGRMQRPELHAVWLALAAVIVVAAVLVARSDPLTWITVAFALFALLLGPAVWLIHLAYTRTLLPLYVFGAIAVLGRQSAAFASPTLPWRVAQGDQARAAPLGTPIEQP
jgi:hypothetical protein